MGPTENSKDPQTTFAKRPERLEERSSPTRRGVAGLAGERGGECSVCIAGVTELNSPTTANALALSERPEIGVSRPLGFPIRATTVPCVTFGHS